LQIVIFRRGLGRAAARIKPLVPARVWPTLLAARSLAGSGPALSLPPLRRVLVLAAHPDDESMGCGGTLALLSDAGADVSLVFASDGEATIGSTRSPSLTAALRRQEAAAAGRILGIRRPPVFLGHPDGALPEAVEALAASLTTLVAQRRPEAVFLPWFLDGHDDHRAMTEVLSRADLPAALQVWGFEVWTPLPVTRLVDITAVEDRKRAALAAHRTAHAAFDVSAALHLSRWRSLHTQLGNGSAEAFITAPLRTYLELAAYALPIAQAAGGRS
jgi:LmbE family N-acetylglucosaminyl deacetylase